MRDPELISRAAEKFGSQCVVVAIDGKQREDGTLLIQMANPDEKQAMMKLISSRLTKADITYLASLAAGGLEGDEISKAYKVAKERFSPHFSH